MFVDGFGDIDREGEQAVWQAAAALDALMDHAD